MKTRQKDLVDIEVGDGTPLFSSVHPPSEDWKTRIPYIGVWGNRIFDWFYVRLHRPKFSDGAIEPSPSPRQKRD